MEDHMFNDPMLYGNEDYNFNFDQIDGNAQAFESIDPSMTMISSEGSPTPMDDYFLQHPPLSAPGTPLLHHQTLLRSAPSSPHFFDDFSSHPLHIAPPTPYLPRRSFSQPPEEVTFHRGEHWLGPRVQKAAGSKRNQKKKQQKSWRQEPYVRPEPVMQRPTPTSAPSLCKDEVPFASIPGTPMPDLAMMALPDNGDIIHVASNEPEVVQFESEEQGGEQEGVEMKDEDVATGVESQEDLEPVYASVETGVGIVQLNKTAIGLLCSVDHLRRGCDGMKQMILESLSADGETDLQRVLRELRTMNRKVVDLNTKLSILPHKLDDPTPPPVVLPVCGQDIRDIDSEATTKILGWYALPYPQDSFLYERKLLYLQFIGASRELMHRVLD